MTEEDGLYMQQTLNNEGLDTTERENVVVKRKVFGDRGQGTPKWYRNFPYTTPGALFRKSMLLDRDFLNSALGLCTVIPVTFFFFPITQRLSCLLMPATM